MRAKEGYHVSTYTARPRPDARARPGRERERACDGRAASCKRAAHLAPRGAKVTSPFLCSTHSPARPGRGHRPQPRRSRPRLRLLRAPRRHRPVPQPAGRAAPLAVGGAPAAPSPPHAALQCARAPAHTPRAYRRVCPRPSTAAPPALRPSRKRRTSPPQPCAAALLWRHRAPLRPRHPSSTAPCPVARTPSCVHGRPAANEPGGTYVKPGSWPIIPGRACATDPGRNLRIAGMDDRTFGV